MKTINILTTMGLAAGMLALPACSDDFLEVESHTQDTVENYYTTPEHIYQALIAAYSPTQWNDWNGIQYNPQNLMSEIMADDFWVGGESLNDNKYWHLMANYEAIPTDCMTGIWYNAYKGIKRANDVLAYAAGARDQFGTQNSELSLWTDEARVLRAYYYNLLWKFYGNIPYYEANLDAPFFAPQLTADDVYAHVIADLEDVIGHGTLPLRWDDANAGRMSKAVAYMLYTEMAMYQNDEARYTKALGMMKELINGADYSLAADYATLFATDGEWCEESIYEVNYTDDHSARGWSVYEARVAGGTVLPRLAFNAAGVSEIGADKGWGFGPVRLTTRQMYDPADARRDVCAMDISVFASWNPENNRIQDEGIWCGKWIPYSANVARATGDGQLNYNTNLRVYRYAEVLLNAAELALRTGTDTGNARTWLNEVRHRAGLGDVEATLDNVIEERHLEFVGEGKRYWDLVRTGKAASVLRPDLKGIRTNTWSPDHKYLPIPYNETAADPNLKQNPAYL